MMMAPLPKWIMQRCLLSWVNFKDKEFNHKQTTKTLPDNEKVGSVVLSEMRKTDWLERRLNSEDARKKSYKLKSLDDVIKEIAKVK